MIFLGPQLYLSTAWLVASASLVAAFAASATVGRTRPGLGWAAGLAAVAVVAPGIGEWMRRHQEVRFGVAGPELADPAFQDRLSSYFQHLLLEQSVRSWGVAVVVALWVVLAARRGVQLPGGRWTSTLLVWLVSLPVQVTAITQGELRPLAWIGLAVAVAGLVLRSRGDAVVWWGVWLVAATAWPGWFTVVSPLLMTWLVVRRHRHPRPS